MPMICFRRAVPALRRALPLLTLLLLAAACRAQGPQITKVEPPNWWVGHTVNPVRLLLRGSHLTGAQVTPGGTGLHVANIKTSAAGTYLFCDLSISPQAAPGARTLAVTTPLGSANAPFALLPPLDPTGKFAGFSPDDVVYLLLPDRFSDGNPANNDPAASPGLYDRANPHYYHGGDFQGIINHLPYLKDLGVTALWITPVYQNVMHLNTRETDNGKPITDYHGYGAVDFYGVEDHFGTMATLQSLVNHAHALGIKVIQDEVANHTGPYHPWAADPPTPTWFNGTVAHHLTNTFDIPTLVDPHNPPAVQKPTLDGWFINILPDLNQGDPEVARYEIQNTLWWVGMAGFDGVREDTMAYVPRAFMQQWSAALRRQFPHLEAVGEVYNGDVTVTSFFQGGQARFDGVDTGVASLYDFPLYYPIRRAFAQGQSLREVVSMLGHDSLYPRPERLMTFLGLHDVDRFMNEQGATPAGLELAQTFLLTTRGIPMLYYGDELAMTGGGDPDNRRDFPGGWPADPANAFDAQGRTPAQQAVWTHVQTLARLRAASPALRRGALTTLYAADQQYVYVRTLGTDAVVVALNNDAKPATLTFPIAPAPWPDGTPLTDHLGIVTGARVDRGQMTLTLPARSGAVLTR